MDEFKVKLDQMKSSVNENKQMARELSSIRNELYSVKRRLSFRISQRERIDRRLTMQGEKLEEEKKKMDQITSALTDITNLYEKTEMELCGQNGVNEGNKIADWLKDIIVDIFKFPDLGPGENKYEEWLKKWAPILPPFLPFVVKPWIPIFTTIGNPPLIPWLIIPSFFPTDIGDSTIPGILGGLNDFINGGEKKVVPWKTEWTNELEQNKEMTSGGVESVIAKAFKDAAKSEDGGKWNDAIKKGTDKYEDVKDKVEKFSEDHTKTLGEKKFVFEKEVNAETGEEKISRKTVDTENKSENKAFDDELEASKMDADVKATLFTAGGSAAYWTNEKSVNGKYGSISAKATVGQAEAHAEGYAGLFQADPTTGELQFKPGIGGSIGGSLTAFTAEEEAMLGNDMLGVYAKSTQTAGKVGAEAEGSVGLYDKDGNFNPSAYAGFSAQAIAGEITGSVGAKVLGADVSASGSLNYGFGAHANVGYKDGKVSLDIGATVGVGGSVSLEIDVSGTIDAACDLAEAAWDKAGDAVSGFADGVKNFFNW
ncbi:MAG: hypothetical protein HFG49_09635 [Lachnospiraceae bacterium]|jgi:hypothetical protein|nr:hypothetical protein [Lachnospiraceae bacterium]